MAMEQPKFDHLYVEDDVSVEGLGHEEALERLIEDVEALAQEFKSKRAVWSHLKDIVSPFQQQSILNISSLVLLIISSLILLATDLALYFWLGLLVCAATSAGVNIWDNYCHHYEIYYRIQYVLGQLRDCVHYKWNENSYPHLYMPFSPCINLQWTYRAGAVVNVPWSLLVRGDFILLRPGQPAPAYCTRYQPKDGCINELKFGDIYNPTRSFNPRVSKPTARDPVENAVFVLQNTPYVRNLEGTLLQCVGKPVDYYTATLYTLNVKWLQFTLYPLLFVLVILVNVFRAHLISSDEPRPPSWFNDYLAEPLTITLPLLPAVLPVAWFLLNNYGNAVLQSSYQLDFATSESCLDVKRILHKKHILNLSSWSVLRHNLISCLKGDGRFVTRTSNLLHVLGSVSTICCVDKKGILSWPNPTAEKVFFLRSPNSNDLLDVRDVSEEPTPRPTAKLNKEKPTNQEEELLPHDENKNDEETALLSSGDGLHTSESQTEAKQNPQRQGTLEKKRVHIVEHIGDTLIENNGVHNNSTAKKCDKAVKHYKPVAEVLDLTHNKYSPFELNFDNPQWFDYLSCLKPLGLAILLNTCNKFTQAHYTQFCSHVTCQALYSDLLVPVANRRCLCELAKQIGFAYNAAESYRLDLQLSTYRHFPAEKIRRDISFARALQLPVQTKLKFPFPHMVAVIVSETGAPQLFSQGTADILLDSCIDYWNGDEVVALTLSDRKKIQDFYQRTSLLAYCTAFAYRPLLHQIDKNLSSVYIELSPECKQLYEYCQSPELMPSSQSSDNIFGKEKVLSDVGECFQEECNQVFIGMVTMQYQTIHDMVDLVEELDHACIRFVHFSKENELRSRVFSEKMGLESGWNCHISLSSDQNQKKNAYHSDTMTSQGLDERTFKEETLMEEAWPLLNIYPCSLSQSRGMSVSAPNTCTDELEEVRVDVTSGEDRPDVRRDSGDGLEEDLGEYKENFIPAQSLGSNSCLTEVTDQGDEEDGVGFDMSNRARLPRGIENIRPHLKCVDNIPLQVSLFTECTSDLTRQMLEIMQEYEQIICVVGSCANNENFPIFSQADVSIAVEPLYPQVCQRIPVLPQHSDKEEVVQFPHQIAHLLNSVPCCLILNREKSIKIASYIMEARHLMQRFWSCVQFWICCVTFLSLLQFIAFLFNFPPILSLDGLVFLILIIVPVISMSLVGTGFVDAKILRQATSKNHYDFNVETGLYIVWCYGFKFLVSLISCILFHFTMLSANCHFDRGQYNTTSTIETSPSFNNTASRMFGCSSLYPSSSTQPVVIEPASQFRVLGSIQQLQLCLVIIHLLIISYSFVYRDYNIWTSCHYSNILWKVISCFVFVSSALFTILLYTTADGVAMTTGHVIIFCVSGLVVFVVCEFIKLQEIEKNVRYQKRARLDFDTKLGMNSPF